MSAAVLQAHDALRPRGDSRLGLGAALALLAHGGLVGALALGLNWRLPQTPVPASAELWAAVPQAAAPAPVAAPAPAPTQTPLQPPAPVHAPPPPAPAPKPQPAPTPPGPSAAEREAAIALEKALTRKKDLDAQAARQAREAAERERQRLADEKLDKAQARQRELQAKADKADKAAAEDKRQKAAAEQRDKAQKDAEVKAQEAVVAQQREENLKRMLGQAGATGNASSTGNAARDAAPSAAYAGKIKAFIKPNILLAVDVPGNPITEVEVKLAPDGSVINQRIVKASGNSTWDSIVQRAIEKTARLPRDSDGRVPPTMLLVFPRRE